MDNNRIKPGDKVEVFKTDGRWIAGELITLLPGSYVQVSIKRADYRGYHIVPWNNVKHIARVDWEKEDTE